MTTAAALLAGRYRLVEPVGRGGMAEVWRCHDVRLGRPVAVKLIVTPRGDGATVTEQALREARDAARLVHPNVVAVYDVGVDGGRLFIVMEWLAGRDLATVLERHGPLPPLDVAWIGAQTARALAAAHATGIVHRDVKPANLLLTRGNTAGRERGGDGLVKLADFGIAVQAPPGPEAAGPVDTGPLMGTTAYVSPEQVMGRPAGPASDLYALGCTMYELLVGRPPFSGHDTAEVMRLHLAQDPAPPGRLRTGVPADLERLILSLLTKDAAGRPADAREVAGELEAFVVAGTSRPGLAEVADVVEGAGGDGAGRTAAAGATAGPATSTARMTPPSPFPVPHVPPDPAPQAGRVSRRQAVITATVALAAVLVAALAVTVSANSPDRTAREPAVAGRAPTSMPGRTTQATHPPARTAAPRPGRSTKPKADKGKKPRNEKPASANGDGREPDGGGKGHGGHGKGHK
ncbi:MAG TPA: serine/threonine-protein kinase [Streptosporangiaceae bacterium]